MAAAAGKLTTVAAMVAPLIIVLILSSVLLSAQSRTVMYNEQQQGGGGGTGDDDEGVGGVKLSCTPAGPCKTKPPTDCLAQCRSIGLNPPFAVCAPQEGGPICCCLF